MRFGAVVLASFALMSEIVYAADFTPVIPETFWFKGSNSDLNRTTEVFVEVLPSQNGEGYSAQKVSKLDLAYEKNNLGVLFNVKNNTVLYRIPYGTDIDAATKQFTCGKDVGLGARASYAQPKNPQQETLAFCSSVLVEPVKESMALKGFGKALTLLGGVASAGTQVITPFQAKLNREKFVEVITREDVVGVLSKIKNDFLATQAKEEAEQKAYKDALYNKGQKFITETAVGETLCISSRGYTIYAFIENVRGQKVQLRINRVVRTDLNEYAVKEGASASSITYRTGEIIWSDASLWSACQ